MNPNPHAEPFTNPYLLRKLRTIVMNDPGPHLYIYDIYLYIYMYIYIYTNMYIVEQDCQSQVSGCCVERGLGDGPPAARPGGGVRRESLHS